MTSCATHLRKYLIAFSAPLLVMQLAMAAAQGQTRITDCGTVIDSPGQYVLANDLLNCPQNGVFFNTAAELNLNGHRITGTSTSGNGIQILTVGRGGTTRIIGPGTIENFRNGVSAAFSEVDIAGVTVFGARQTGLILGGAFGNLRNNRAEDCHTGFEVAGTSGGEVQLTGNTASRNIGDGILLNRGTTGVMVTNNTATSNGASGIAAFPGASGNHIISNVASGNGNYDLYEGNSSCVNEWRDNMFVTRNRDCIH